MANDIVTVGSEGRSEILASLLTEKTTKRSKRGFVTHTGKYNGVPVSVVLINMGWVNTQEDSSLVCRFFLSASEWKGALHPD